MTQQADRAKYPELTVEEYSNLKAGMKVKYLANGCEQTGIIQEVILNQENVLEGFYKDSVAIMKDAKEIIKIPFCDIFKVVK